MKALLRTEFYKMAYSNQMLVTTLCIVAYVGILPFFNLMPGQYTILERYRNITSDIAVMTIIISLLSSTIFAGEYTQKTLKNMVEYYNRSKIFLAKIIVILAGIAGLLLLWYLIGILPVMIQTQSVPDLTIIFNYIKRFSIQVLVIVLQASCLLLLSVLTKKQAFVNIASFVVFLAFTLTPYYQWILTNYPWGSWGLPAIYLSLIGISIVMFLIAYLIFRRQEVRG